jgi:hypothetical protein
MGANPMPTVERPGLPLWRDIGYYLKQLLCGWLWGRHDAHPVYYGGCRRCGHTMWTLPGEDPTAHPRMMLGLGALYWRQVNRYRDTIRPWARAHPAAAAWWFNIYACPECDDLQPASAVAEDGCETCAFLYWQAPGLRAIGRNVRRRKRRRGA